MRSNKHVGAKFSDRLDMFFFDSDLMPLLVQVSPLALAVFCACTTPTEPQRFFWPLLFLLAFLSPLLPSTLLHCSLDCKSSSCSIRLSSLASSHLPLHVCCQENYLKVKPSLPAEEMKEGDMNVIERMAAAAESISNADLVNNNIRGLQQWSLLPFFGIHSFDPSFEAHPFGRTSVDLSVCWDLIKLPVATGMLATVRAGQYIRGNPPNFFTNEFWRRTGFTKVRWQICAAENTEDKTKHLPVGIFLCSVVLGRRCQDSRSSMLMGGLAGRHWGTCQQ